ncbi:MAG: hypothetical protein WC687_05220, partial [Patescibacteria group bacterium]
MDRYVFSIKCSLVLSVLILWCGVVGFAIVPRINAADACEQTCTQDENAENDDAFQNCILEKRSCLESRIKEVQSQKVTLSNTLTLINGRAAVQELQIKQ